MAAANSSTAADSGTIRASSSKGVMRLGHVVNMVVLWPAASGIKELVSARLLRLGKNPPRFDLALQSPARGKWLPFPSPNYPARSIVILGTVTTAGGWSVPSLLRVVFVPIYPYLLTNQ